MKQKYIGKLLKGKEGRYLQTFGVERSIGSLFEDFDERVIEVTICDLKEELAAEEYLKKLATPCFT